MQETQKRMKSLKKASKNSYYITLFGVKLKLHINTIVKYELLNTYIPYSVEEIIKFNDDILLEDKIIKYFIKYPKSIKEAKYILTNKYNIVDDNIINKLIKLKVLDDNRLKESIIFNLENKLYGPNYIRNYLNTKGLGNEYNHNYSNDELIFIFNKLTKNKEKNRQKLYQLLIRRGYYSEDIISYLNLVINK